MPIHNFPVLKSSLPKSSPSADEASEPVLCLPSEYEYKEDIFRARAAYIKALHKAVNLYSEYRQFRTAQAYLEHLQLVDDSPESQALILLTLGQFSESCKDYPLAIDYYRQGLALEPVESEVWYLINNNLGFSLNAIDRFADGEPYCRAAIQINPKRHNAYKNLGISLQGMGQLREAARLYVQAAQMEAQDPRALRLLRALVDEHPELLQQEAGLAESIAACQRAVDAAEEARRILRENRRSGENPPADTQPG